MKAAIISVVVTILSFAFMYAVGAFLGNELNSSLWSRDGRFFYLLASFAMSAILSVIFLNMKEDK